MLSYMYIIYERLIYHITEWNEHGNFLLFLHDIGPQMFLPQVIIFQYNKLEELQQNSNT